MNSEEKWLELYHMRLCDPPGSWTHVTYLVASMLPCIFSKGLLVDIAVLEYSELSLPEGQGEVMNEAKPGDAFRPLFWPVGFWLLIDDFAQSPNWEAIREPRV